VGEFAFFGLSSLCPGPFRTLLILVSSFAGGSSAAVQNQPLTWFLVSASTPTGRSHGVVSKRKADCTVCFLSATIFMACVQFAVIRGGQEVFMMRTYSAGV
jgi:hypothetical protein